MYTDEYILNLLKQDREKAAQILVEEYSALLGSVCAKKLENPEDIYECVNDTFAEFFQNYNQYDPAKGSLKSYLCSIARHKSVDQFRKNYRQAALEKELVNRQKEEQIRQKAGKKEVEQLEEAMEKLPPQDQQILKMHYFDDLSYKEISEELNLSYETVKKRGLRGKKKLLYLILLGLLIIGITACTTIVMKKNGLLPTWFPFYDIIPGEVPENEDGLTGESNDRWRNQLKDVIAKGNSTIENTQVPLTAGNTVSETENIKKYYYSARYGLIEADAVAYELLTSSQSFEKDGVRYEVKNAFYQAGVLRIDILVTELVDEGLPLGAKQDECTSYMKKAYIMSANGEKAFLFDMKGDISLKSTLVMEENKKTKSYLYESAMKWTPQDESAQTMEVVIVFPEGNTLTLIMEKMVEKEYIDSTQESEESGEKSNLTAYTIPGIGTLKTGIAATQDGSAVIELYQENIEDYTVSDMITFSRLGYYVDKNNRKCILIDEEGNQYERTRLRATDITTENGAGRKFEISYEGIDSGKYTLEISCLGIETGNSTDVVKIPLPTGEEEYLEYECELLFPDGAGYHVMGIERSEDVEVQYNTELGFYERKYWCYRLFYEPIHPTETIDFCSAYLTGTDSNGIQIKNIVGPWKEESSETQYLRVESDDMPEYVSLQFRNPVYVLNQEFLFDITIP